MKPLILAIDFDGTIVEHDYPRIGRDIGAFPWLSRFQANGARLILYTMRSGKTLNDAVLHCAGMGITFWGVNENPEQHEWTESPKVYANHYIDDAAHGVPLIQPAGWTHRVTRPFVDWSVVGPAVLDLLSRRS